MYNFVSGDCAFLLLVLEAERESRFSAEVDEYGADHMSEIHIAGRIVINLWRVIKHEVKLGVVNINNTYNTSYNVVTMHLYSV